MKYAVFFLLVVVAMAAAAPQLLTTGLYGPGYLAPGIIGGPASTLVAGPTVVNNPLGWGSRYITPGYIGGIY